MLFCLLKKKKKNARCFKYELSTVCKTTEVLYQKKDLKRKKSIISVILLIP